MTGSIKQLSALRFSIEHGGNALLPHSACWSAEKVSVFNTVSGLLMPYDAEIVYLHEVIYFKHLDNLVDIVFY